MKYLVRAVKYFFYLLIILSLMIAILVALDLVEGGVENLFRGGWSSIWKILALAAVFAGIYPRTGYCKRSAYLLGSTDEILPGIREYMDNRGYKLTSREGDNLVFRRRSPFGRAAKMWEDTLTFTRTVDGYEIEGQTKEVVRVVSGLEAKFRGPEEQ